ncbi:MAG: hypothetical protein D6815_03750 [Candidatus Dadabacteria bacterium]|nr:MAG: hypothetical protein D6815_03750 [Candidatus Dadabacteria bacterium]
MWASVAHGGAFHSALTPSARQKPGTSGLSDTLNPALVSYRVNQGPRRSGDRSSSLPAAAVLPALVALTLAIRIAAIFALHTYVMPPYEDYTGFGAEMGQIAASIAAGDGYSFPANTVYPPNVPLPLRDTPQPTAWMPPLYPALMAATFVLFGSYSQSSALILFFIQSFVAAGACILLFLLARRAFDERTGLVAAALFSVYPPGIYMASRLIWATTITTALVLLFCLLVLRCLDRGRVRDGVLLGAVGGLAALSNPASMTVFPFVCLWLALGRATRKRPVAVVAAVVFTAVIAPWVARNYAVFGRLVPIKSNFGNELAKGNNEYADGHWWTPEWRKTFTPEELDFLASADEVSRNRFLLKKGTGYIRYHPLRFLRLTAARIWLFWTYTRVGDVGSPYSGKDLLMALGYFPMLLLAAAGLAMTRRREAEYRLSVLYLAVFPLPYYVAVAGLMRYRLPIEPLLMMFAAHAVMQIATRISPVRAR